MTEGAASRAVAADVVGRVVRSGAYSNVLLRTATASLEANDRALVYADVYAVLRNLAGIDALIEDLSGRSMSAIDDDLADRLRIGIAELAVVGTPPHAAVDSVVGSIAERRRRGFVNAVLRKAVGETLPVPRLPDWLRARLADDWGEEFLKAFEGASLADAPLGVRLRPGADEVGDPVPGIPSARWLPDASGLAGMVEAGKVTVADPASVAVGNTVDAHPGEYVLDMAAAPGGKTSHLSDAMGERGVLVAADRHARRLRSARSRLGPDGTHWVVMDGTSPAMRRGRFDRVLLDAPCTGLGTLRRRPEIAWRLEPGSIDRLARLQRRLLAAARELVKPGGRVVYAVCTVTKAETTGVTEPDGRSPDDVPGNALSSGVLLGPHIGRTDGMFISVFDG